MMRTTLLFILLISLFTNCESSEECFDTPCPGPFLNQMVIRFQFIDSLSQVIDLNTENIKGTKWTIENSKIEQHLVFDTTQNIGAVFLIEQSIELIDNDYTITTAFGEPQTIHVDLDKRSLFQNRCNPCIQYFISTIRQNENRLIFSGELTDEEIIIIEVN